MKNILSIGCLLIMLLLSACGLQSPGNNSAATPEVPEKTETPVMAEASVPPESSVAPVTETAAPEAEAPAQTPYAEPTVGLSTQKEVIPAQEAKTPAPAAVTIYVNTVAARAIRIGEDSKGKFNNKDTPL